MKNFKYLFAFIALGFISCETDTGDESFMENRDVIAGFTATSGTIFATAEGTNTFVLTVAVSQIMSADKTFEISVDETSTAVLGTDFTLSANSIVIPAGGFSGSVNVVADFDAASFDGKSLVFNLTPAAGSLLGKAASCSLEIVKSCPIPDALEASYTANPFAFNEDAPEFTATFTRVGTTGLTYAVDSGWGPEFVAWATGIAGYSGLYIYPCELTVNADGTVAVTGSSYYTGGSGTFDACTGVISVTLTQALFTTPFTVDVTFTP